MEKQPAIVPGTLEYIEEDLRRLASCDQVKRDPLTSSNNDSDDELPPLIQVAFVSPVFNHCQFCIQPMSLMYLTLVSPVFTHCGCCI